LRDYGIEGQLGLEVKPELYIDKMITIFDEVKRVLRKDGTCFVNLGDTYNSHRDWSFSDWESKKTATEENQKNPLKDYPIKSLCMIPERFAFAMINRGWILRNKICWFKPNHMPSSVKDRFSNSWEYLYMFVKNNQTLYWTNEKTLEITDKQPLGIKGVKGKDWEWKQIDNSWERPSRNETFKLPSRQKSAYAKSKRKKVSLWSGHDYWFDLNSVRETHKRGTPQAENDYKRMMEGRKEHEGIRKNRGPKIQNAFIAGNPAGKNPGDHWEITTKGFPEAHFAVYPEALCIKPIKAGCPEWICKKCGKAKVRITNYTGDTPFGSGSGKAGRTVSDMQTSGKWQGDRGVGRMKLGPMPKPRETIGWTDCKCKAGFEAGIVLDPFSGAGTTCMTAKKLNRRYIGIELNKSYIEMSEKRIEKECGTLF